MDALSIVLPAHNEEETVGAVIDEVVSVMQQLGVEHEILVVDDGSLDRTGEIAHRRTQSVPGLRVIAHHPGRGYGGALKAGFAVASKEWIVFFPTDGQFVFAEVNRFLDRIGDADIVCGYRADRRDHLVRKLNALGWNLVVRTLFGYLCRDVDCGFKLFRRAILDQVTLVSEGAMIDTELLAGARSRGYRIAEVPVTHLARQAGEATGAHLGVIAKAFRDVVRFRVRLSLELRKERISRSIR